MKIPILDASCGLDWLTIVGLLAWAWKWTWERSELSWGPGAKVSAKVSHTNATSVALVLKLLWLTLHLLPSWYFWGLKDASCLCLNFMSTIEYYISLESSECQLSNATGSASFGVLQLELYSMEGEEVSWPDCMLVLCSSMHITGLFSPSIFSIHHACHICLESSRCLLSNAFRITSLGVL